MTNIFLSSALLSAACGFGSEETPEVKSEAPKPQEPKQQTNDAQSSTRPAETKPASGDVANHPASSDKPKSIDKPPPRPVDRAEAPKEATDNYSQKDPEPDILSSSNPWFNIRGFLETTPRLVTDSGFRNCYLGGGADCASLPQDSEK